MAFLDLLQVPFSGLSLFFMSMRDILDLTHLSFLNIFDLLFIYLFLVFLFHFVCPLGIEDRWLCNRSSDQLIIWGINYLRWCR